jgi:hypothetical protein
MGERSGSAGALQEQQQQVPGAALHPPRTRPPRTILADCYVRMLRRAPASCRFSREP